MRLPDKIQLQRKRLGISQEKLGEVIGVSRQAITKWETGSASPEIDKVLALSDYFCVSTDYLLKDDFTEPEETPYPLISNKKRLSLRMKIGVLLLVVSLLAFSVLWRVSLHFPVSVMTGVGVHLTGFSGFVRYYQLIVECYFTVAIGVAGFALIAIEVAMHKAKSCVATKVVK